MIAPSLELTGWVGAQATGAKGPGNDAADVVKVQDALNAIPVHEGGPARLLSLDGIAGRLTRAAIQEFQLRHFGWKIADGRVDPQGKTWPLMCELLRRHGGTRWSIHRLEQRLRPDKPFRDADSRDRFYEIHSESGIERAVFYFQTPDQDLPRGAGMVPFELDGRPEFCWFDTVAPCSVYAFASRTALHTETSLAPHQSRIRLLLRPVRGDAAPAGLTLQIEHQWIVPTQSVGQTRLLDGSLRFVRAQCIGVARQKTPRPLG